MDWSGTSWSSASSLTFVPTKINTYLRSIYDDYYGLPDNFREVNKWVLKNNIPSSAFLQVRRYIEDDTGDQTVKYFAEVAASYHPALEGLMKLKKELERLRMEEKKYLDDNQVPPSYQAHIAAFVVKVNNGNAKYFLERNFMLQKW